MKGGIQAWEGPVAEGPVELNLDLIRGDETPVEIIQLAYGMEMTLGAFYTTMIERIEDTQVVNLLRNLASIEEKHKQYLQELYRTVQASEINIAAFEAEVSSKIMEGGFDSAEFINKNDKFMQTVPGLLDISMMLETQALDLYLRFSQKMQDEHAQKILFKIADEEKGHLKALGRLREEKA